MSNRLNRKLAAALASGAILVGACSDQGPVAPNGGSTPTFAPASLQGTNRYIVSLKVAEKPDFQAAVTALGGTVERRHPDILRVTVTGFNSTAAATLAQRADVSRIDQDLSLQWIPSPAQFAQGLQHLSTPGPKPQGTDQSGAAFLPFQWNLPVVSAPAAWTATPGGAGKEVCVLDTGIDPGHLDTDGKIDLANSVSMVASEPFIEDFNLHGTFVSALISSNGIGMASVAPDTKLCMIKVLDFTGNGSFGDVIAGIIAATERHVNVINMSLGAYVDKTQPGVEGLIDALQSAINFATGRGVLVVTSAGNSAINLDEDGKQFLELPAQLKNVLDVGATAPVNQQNFDLLASYSNFGGVTGIKMVAPGGDFVAAGQVLDLILSACSRYTLAFDCTDGVSYLFGAGTSFASPHVAGAAAVVESNKGITKPATVTRCLLNGTDNVGPIRFFGAGRLNVLKASGCPGL